MADEEVDLNGYYKAVNEADPAKRLRCCVRGMWRPVLRNDPYKLEEAKFRFQA